MATNDNVTWITIDPESLNDATFRAYEALREAQSKARTAREAFETLVQNEAPRGKTVLFGYRFGKLAIALTDGEKAPRKATVKAASLDDVLAASRPGSRVHRL